MSSQPGITVDSWAKRFGPWVATIGGIVVIVGALVTSVYFVGDGKWVGKPAYAQDLATHSVERRACESRLSRVETDVAVIKQALDGQSAAFNKQAQEVRDLVLYLRANEGGRR